MVPASLGGVDGVAEVLELVDHYPAGWCKPACDVRAAGRRNRRRGPGRRRHVRAGSSDHQDGVANGHGSLLGASPTADTRILGRQVGSLERAAAWAASTSALRRAVRRHAGEDGRVIVGGDVIVGGYGCAPPWRGRLGSVDHPRPRRMTISVSV